MQSKAMKNFMAKLYGFGAAIVIVGAMFKIMHWPGAGPMLVVGLSTEAIIFFFSAFEIPHEDPDWTLVYPELAAGHSDADDFGGDEKDEKKELTGTISQQLDQMMEEAKIGPELITSLGTGLRSFSDNISKMVNLTDTSVETNSYNENVKKASQSLSTMNDSYGKSRTAIDDLTNVSSNVKNNLSSIADASGSYATSMKSAKTSLDEINVSYTKALSAMDQLSESSAATKDYNKQVEQMTKNLSSLNSLYEIQLQDSNKKLVESINELVSTTQTTKTFNEQIQETSKAYTQQMREITTHLGSLNELYVTEIEDSSVQLKAMKDFYGGITGVMKNLNDSMEDSKKYKHEISQLTRNLGTLNAVYGNMLSAMRMPVAAGVDNNS